MTKTKLALLFCIFALVSCNGKVSEAEFTSTFITKLKELNSKIIIVSSSSLEVEYKLPESKYPAKAFLDNAYRNYLNGDSIDDVLDKYAKSSSESLNDVDVEAANIVPVIKDNNYLGEVAASLSKQNANGQKFDFFGVPFGHYFTILYAVDTPENIRYINKEDFEKLSMDEADLRSIAIENLRRKLPPITLNGGAGLFMVTADGNYESSLLLFANLWADLKTKVDGDLIMALPSRDVLLVTGSKNKRGIEIIKDKVNEVFETASYTLSRDIYVSKNNSWEIYSGF